MTLCIIDTGILCELLEVPNLCGSSSQISARLEEKYRNGEFLLLPLCTILETGNHIGQNGDGRQRRDTAYRFARMVEQAVRGETPFEPTYFAQPKDLLGWVRDFAEWAGRGAGLGDLTIFKEFERQCEIYRARRVYIWSTDRHLTSYHREP